MPHTFSINKNNPAPKSLKRIALLTDGVYPYVVGGMQRHSYYLAKYLAQNGIQVDLYHTQAEKQYDINKLEFFTDQEKKNIRAFAIEFPEKGSFPGHYIRNSYAYSVKVYQQLKKNLDVDFIYGKGFAGWKLIEEKTKGGKLPPIGSKFHGLEMFQSSPTFKEKIAQYLFRSPVLYNMKNADHVFSYGGKITDILVSKGIPVNKIIEIPTGISEDWLSDKEVAQGSKVRFLFIGRYERRKGIEELNRVVKRIIKQQDFDFNFIGPIPEEKKIISRGINYYGAITDTRELKKIISESDVLVCPSHSEGMPNVILEAMSFGLAVIATDVGAVSEMVSSENGWLIKAGSVDELEEAIVGAIVLEKSLLEKKRKSSRELVERKFLWKKIIKQTIFEIEKVI